MTDPTFILEKYRLLERLGEGGMGTVFRARDELLDRDVAIKQLRPHLLADGGLSERFRAEAMVLARLNHPSIAALHGLERQDGCFYMVMEYLPGETLEALVARGGALPWQRAIEITTAVLDALQHAHERGIVHRDIKPANIMVTPDGAVKVMDFGIARVMGRTRHTRQGHAVGTPAYMSPEQLRGEEVDGRADLYALGMVLYELLVGRVAFDADSDYRLMMMQLHDTPAAPGSLVAGVPPELDRVVSRAMAKRPSDRYAGAAAMREALAEVVRKAAGSTNARRGSGFPIMAELPAAARAALSRSVVSTAGWQEELRSWVADWRSWAIAGCLVAASMLTLRALAPRGTQPALGTDDAAAVAALDGGGDVSTSTSQQVDGTLANAPVQGGDADGAPGITWGGPPPRVPTGLAPAGAGSGGTGSGGAGSGGAVPGATAPRETVTPAPRTTTRTATGTGTGTGARGNTADAGAKEAAEPAAPASRQPAGGDGVTGSRGSSPSNEAGLRDAAMATAAGFLSRMASGDAAAAAAISGGGATGELGTLVREKRVSGATPRDLSLSLEGDRGRATADVELAWRTAFGGNRRSTIQMVMELRRQGTSWRVEAARMTGGALR